MSSRGAEAPVGTVPAYVGLGSNLGDSADIVRAAMVALAGLPGTRLVRASRLYRTPAWGMTAQPDFINAAAMIETRLSPPDLLAAMMGIERDAGRERCQDGSDRWGPRTLDLDLLLYGDQVIEQPGLRVPHPHLHEDDGPGRPQLRRALVGVRPDRHLHAAREVLQRGGDERAAVARRQAARGAHGAGEDEVAALRRQVAQKL